MSVRMSSKLIYPRNGGLPPYHEPGLHRAARVRAGRAADVRPNVGLYGRSGFILKSIVPVPSPQG